MTTAGEGAVDERLIDWAQLTALEGLCEVLPGYRTPAPVVRCDANRLRWYKPGYLYPCRICERRAELMRRVTA